MGLTACSSQGLIGGGFLVCQLLSHTRNGAHTQKEISYTRAAFFSNGSARRNCFNVSIVLGWMPSAFPVEVLSGRSSRMITSIPKRTRLHLVPLV